MTRSGLRQSVATTLTLVAVALVAFEGVPARCAWAADAPSDLFSVAFSDASHGWAVGDNGTIVSTTDGGLHWTKRSSGTTDYLVSVSFPDATHGWTVGNYNAKVPGGGVSCSAIFATTDGGAHWTIQKAGKVSYYLSSVHFIDPNVGWAVGYYRTGELAGQGYILSTTDGGAHWTASVSGRSEPLESVFFTNPENGWAVGGSFGGEGVILSTTDGGKNWTTQATVSHGLDSVRFADADHGWAVGVLGTIVATTDGGAHWNAQKSHTDMALWSAAFPDAMHGWAVGPEGKLLATIDGGATWTTRKSPTGLDLWSVDFPDAAHGWIVSRYGTILSTADGGAHWGVQATTLPTTTKLRCPLSVRVRKTLKLRGTVSPAVAPGRVTISRKRRVGNKWKSVGTVRVNVVNGKFSYSFKPTHRGTWRLKASYVGGAVGNITYWGSYSSIKTVRVL